MQRKLFWGAALAALVGLLTVAAPEPLQTKVAGWFGQNGSRSTSAPGPDGQGSDSTREQEARPEVRDEELLARHLTDHGADTPARASDEEPVMPEDLAKLPEAERMAYLARERFGPRVAPTQSESARYNVPTARIEKQRDGRYWVITSDGPSRPDLPPGTIVEPEPVDRK